MNDCEKCNDYLAARRDVLLPHIGRWVQQHGKPPRQVVGALLRGAHARHV